MAPLLVLGAGGQVGHELRRAAVPAGLAVVAHDRARTDASDSAAVARAMAEVRPAAVINAAAYTAVDRAEDDAAAAHRANAEAPAILARACAAAAVPLLHVSTDYVFDGTKPGPYDEADPVRPLGAYGASKEAGERAVRAAWDRHLILRTAWVFGAHGHNFVRTMLRLGAERPALSVVDDQRGGPTAAADIAAALIALAARLVRDSGAPAGTYHFAGAPAVTWHGFAQAIFASAARHGRTPPAVSAITTAQYPTRARRPANSVLDCGKLRRDYGIAAPDWRPALDAVVDEMLGETHAR